MPRKAASPAAKKAGAKKPGRPPKAKKAGAKKPGRPPKAAKAGAKKPGRPPKAAKAGAKKPGRPPKAAKAGAKKPGRKPGRPAGSGRRSPAPPAVVHATLRELEARLKSLPKLDIVAPNIPVERLVAEGVELASIAWRDLQKLATAGLDRTIVVELGKRAQALSEAQAELVALRSRGRSSEEEDLIAESTELRSEALAAGRLALRSDPAAQGKLDDIAEGEGLDDLLQDLQDLAAILRTYARAYSGIGLKPAELANWSETLRLRLSKYIAERRAGDAELAAAKDLRDRAATYLTDAIALTRLTGAYVFRKDPRRLLSYRSGYNAELRARAARKAKDPAPAPAPEPSPEPAPTPTDDK